MKRPRSHGEDLDAVSGERGFYKERRDQDLDRPSSHRRFYPKQHDTPRKGSSSSYDRPLNDERRKRFEHESDGFDRRKGFDRHHDGGLDHGSYGERLNRSESFSGIRREFPKGVRSERERSRREISSGSSWRRSSGVDELRSPSTNSDSAGRGNLSASEDRGKVRSRDSSSGEQTRGAELAKEEKGPKESCISSEMEEGELEPDPEPVILGEEPFSHSNPLIGLPCNHPIADESVEGKEIQSTQKGSGFDNAGGACDGNGDGGSLEMEVDRVDSQNDKLPDPQNCSSSCKELSGERTEERGVGDNSGEEEILSLPSHDAELKGQGEEMAAVTNEEVAFSASRSKPEMRESQGQCQVVEAEVDDRKKEEVVGMDLRVVQKDDDAGIDLEAEPEGTAGFFSSTMQVIVESTEEVKLMENPKDKGKSLAISLSDVTPSELRIGDSDTAIEGSSSGRGFELVFLSDANPSDQGNCSSIVAEKHKDENPKLELLDLSLGLPCNLSDHTSKNPTANHNSPSRARSIQSLASSFRTMSDGFTNSISFSGSQTFLHNPSCSLTQNSLDNYEKSVGSRPLFQGVDQFSNGTIWQAQTSNDPKRKGSGGTLFHRALLNGNPSAHNSLRALNGQHHPKPDSLSRQSSLVRQLSPTHSHGSSGTMSENSKDKRILTRDLSSSSLFRSEHRGGENLGLNGFGSIERFVSKIVTEPLQVMSRMLHEMPDHSVGYLKKNIFQMFGNEDNHGQIKELQKTLEQRSDLNMETMAKCPRTLLEILVALKTGNKDVLWKNDDISSSNLVEIFLNLKCRNLACQSSLPVDECDCRVCVQKNGFCRECMCLVCSKFDMASNTCSWVGCDVCLHWCHTDCGLRESHIRNGRSASGTRGITEMQFHCVACDHPSEMFGFVKEVFRTCAKGWKAETLNRELQYVRRIFSASDDGRGKRLCSVADQMLMKLDDKANLSEVINYALAFLSESESNVRNGPSSAFPSKDPARNNAEGSNTMVCSSKEPTWLASISTGKLSGLERRPISNTENGRVMGRQLGTPEVQANLEKKPVIDELESVVHCKQAEAKMYQERADDARREAEGLKRIAVAKSSRIEEDYASHIAKLGLDEAEERRRKKFEELQVIERSHREYFNMKTRMEADIKDLLLKMEATKRNFNT